MKILIDISDEGYDWIKNGFPDNEDEEFLIKAVKNGIVITSTEKAKVGELIDAYTKGFDAGVEIARTERQQGKWIFHKDYNESCRYGCNQCGNLNNIPHNYCPNCGSKMSKEGIKKETTFDDYLKKQLKNPEFRKEWEKLCDEDEQKGDKE